MRRSMRTVTLQTASTLLTVAGAVLVVLVAVKSYFALESNSLHVLSVVDLVLFAAGVGLFVAARRISPGLGRRLTLDAHTRVGRHEPEPSKLEQLGYRVPDESSEGSRPTTAYEDGTLYRLCPECSERNETDFDYCRDCSAKLDS
jgi:hypothetical protein